MIGGRAPGAGLDETGEMVAFRFENRDMRGRRGESLAAALTAAGEIHLRSTAAGTARGLFCGMGVCQECLVEIDGQSNQRACMTKLDRPVEVRRQGARPLLVTPDAPAPDTSILEPDVLVIGAGAAGLSAAISASHAGARVLVADDRPMPGGQYFKQKLAGLPADDRQFAEGRALIAGADAAGVTVLTGSQVWGAFEPLEIMLLADGVGRRCRPRRLIVATGAYERGVPLPGWTLPGVMTTGAAQTLLRSYRVLAGARVLIAGNGPLNLQVGVELTRAGAEVVAVAELAAAPWRRPPLLAAMMAADARLTARGMGYLAALKRRRIPLLNQTALTAVEACASGLRAHFAPWPDRGGVRRTFEADIVCIGYGFMPSNEILRALGCRVHFDAVRGHLVTERDADCRTSRSDIYAAGDCTGLRGAVAAQAEGTIAGLAAASSLGLPIPANAALAERTARAALERQRRFQAALWAVFAAPRPGVELAEADTIVCRCEDVTRAEIEAGFTNGARVAGSLKRATRAGMGACQGRYCGPLIAAIAAAQAGQEQAEALHWASRPPVRPVRIADIVGG